MRTLTFQILWAPSVAGALLMLWLVGQSLVIERDERDRLRQAAERASILGSARLLVKRHDHSIRRVRLAIYDSSQNRRIAVLNDATDYYQRAMRGLTREMRRRMERGPRIGEPRVERLSTRMNASLDAIDTEAALVATSVEAIRHVMEDNESLDENQAVLLEFERTEQAVASKLARLEMDSRHWLSARAEARGGVSARIPLWSLVGGGILVIGCLIFAGWRIQRIGRYGNSNFERRLRERQRRAEHERCQLEESLEETVRRRELAEQALRREEQEIALFRLYHENLVNSLTSAVVVTDLRGRITAVNRAARSSLALRLDQDIYQHPIGEKLRSEVGSPEAILERAVGSDRVLRAMAMSYRRGDEERTIDLSVTAYLDERGSARGLIWIVDDVTDAAETKVRLLRAERLAAVGRLSAQVAHEIRNPLSAIGLNTELLEDELDDAAQDSSEARALLRAIANEIERLTEVTEGYLQLTRPPQAQIEAVDLHAAIRDLLSMLGPELRAHQVNVELRFEDGPDTVVQADAGQLRQALLNVLRNAREAMPSGGSIRITTRKSGGYIVIDVEDEGEGIPEDVGARVFEPFFTTKDEGTGLGLSLTLQFIREQNGDIEVARSAFGGARLRILLPSFPELASSEPSRLGALNDRRA